MRIKEQHAMAKNQNNNVAPATKKTGAEAKKDALATALAQIEKQFGKGAVMKLGDNTAMQVDAISTGSLGLDMALGVGGVPRGRIIEVYGPESSGKTTLALHILAEAQKKGGDVAFIDVEHALDPVYAEALGVDINNLLVSQPDTGEQAMEICEALVRSGAIDAIVVDSVAAMVPRAEIEGEMGDSHVGLQARLMSQAMRKLTSVIGKTNTKAFCFAYAETLDCLRTAGAELVFFSPVHDTALPEDICGLYLPGGYPELYARPLSENKTMRDAIRDAVNGGLPTVAECGGFLYLGQTLEDASGTAWPMAGVLPGKGVKVGRLVRFGYADMTAKADSLLFHAGEHLYIHEFHHWDSTDNGSGFSVWKSEKVQWECGFASMSLYAGFPHLYWAGTPLPRRFVSGAKFYQRQKRNTHD